MAFRILVDSVQQRLKDDGVSTLVNAPDWDLAASSNVYQDGITGMLFLLPGFFQVGWLTTNTGIYAKYAPTDYTLTPASSDPNWIFPTINADGNQWCKYTDNTAGAGGILNSAVPINQAMVIEFSQQNQTGNSDIIGDCGWGSSGDYTTGVSLRFYRDNSADVYKEGQFLAHYGMSGQTQEYGQSQGQVSYQSSNPYISIILIPCRERELLVISSTGGGFSHIFADIPEGTTGATITPNAPFWFYIQPGCDATVRTALCQYASSGNAVGKQSFFRYDPGATPTGGFQSYIDGLSPSGTSMTLQVSDGVTPSSPYANNTNGVRLNVQLSGTGALTPFLLGSRGYTNPETASTVGDGLDVTEYALALSYESGDSLSGARAHLTLCDPKDIAQNGLDIDPTNGPGANIDQISERPWQIFDDDGTQFMEALNEQPKLEEGTMLDDSRVPTYGTTTNENERVLVELRDGSLAADNYLFKEIIPFDGLSVAAAYSNICQIMGFDTPDLSAALCTIYIGQAGNPTEGYILATDGGDKGLEWLDRIHKTYCANYFHGFKPAGAGKFKTQMLAEADMPSTPAVTLYDSEATAIANGVSNPTYLNLFRKVDVQMLRPEANDLYVYGYDYRTRRPILVHKADSVNMDPTVIPKMRTPAWRGARISYTWIDPSLPDVDTCEYVMGLLYDRLTIARSMIEFEADFFATLPRGALVKLVFATGGGIKSPLDSSLQNQPVCRIKTVSTKFEQLSTDGIMDKWRPTRYVASLGTDASILHTQHADLAAIAQEWSFKSVSKTVQWGDALDKKVWRRPIITQDEAA